MEEYDERLARIRASVASYAVGLEKEAKAGGAPVAVDFEESEDMIEQMPGEVTQKRLPASSGQQSANRPRNQKTLVRGLRNIGRILVDEGKPLQKTTLQYLIELHGLPAVRVTGFGWVAFRDELFRWRLNFVRSGKHSGNKVKETGDDD